MATLKARSISTVLLIWLVLPGKCSRQEGELDKLIMDVDKIDASPGEIVSVSQDNASASTKIVVASDMMYGGYARLAAASNKTQADHVTLDFLCWHMGDESGCTTQAQLMIGAGCSAIGECKAGASFVNGAIEVELNCAAKVGCTAKAKNILELATNCQCQGDLIQCSLLAGTIAGAVRDHALPAIQRTRADAGQDWGKFHEVLQGMLGGDVTGWTITVQLTGSVSVGAKAGVALGLWEDKDGYRVVGGGAGGSCGVEIHSLVYLAWKTDGTGFRVAVTIPHFSVVIKVEKNH